MTKGGEEPREDVDEKEKVREEPSLEEAVRVTCGEHRREIEWDEGGREEQGAPLGEDEGR